MSREANNRPPDWMRAPTDDGPATSPVWWLRLAGGEFDPDDARHRQAFDRSLAEVLDAVPDLNPRAPALLKVHIGEPRVDTALRPALLAGSLAWLRRRGCDRTVVGDTTVCYSGPRGHRENGPEAAAYRALAGKRGWTELAPFVVLDRPRTSVAGQFEFEHEQVVRECAVGGRFHRFYLAGGFEAAGTILHHAHLTLHGLSGLALCVKGLTMGLAGRDGKLAMHQSLHPRIDPDHCQGCAACCDCCPEDALEEIDGDCPELDEDACIGCGECLEACPEDALELVGRDVSDWNKGADSLAVRMVDYLVGLMADRWDDFVHIAHMYDVTPRCDCVDERQEPICPSLGFLVGRNPLAVDQAARRLLTEALQAEGIRDGIDHFCPLDVTPQAFEHARQAHGLIVEPELIPVDMQS